MGGFGLGITSSSINKQVRAFIFGNFVNYSGATQGPYLRLLNSDGGADPTFQVSGGTFDGIRTMVKESSGNILAAGLCRTNTGGTQSQFGLARLDPVTGDVINNFNNGSNNAIIHKILLDDDKIILTGSFTGWSGVTHNRIVKLNTGGTIDSAFTTGIGTGFNSIAYTAIKDRNGDYIVGGVFTDYDGTSINTSLAKIGTGGTRDSSFITTISNGSGGSVFALLEDPATGDIYVGGNFPRFNGNNDYTNIAKIDSGGTLDTSFVVTVISGSSQPGFNGQVNDLKFLPNGNILVTGDFETYRGITVSDMISIKPNGDPDVDFAIPAVAETSSISYTDSICDFGFYLGETFSVGSETWTGVSSPSNGFEFIGDTFDELSLFSLISQFNANNTQNLHMYFTDDFGDPRVEVPYSAHSFQVGLAVSGDISTNGLVVTVSSEFKLNAVWNTPFAGGASATPAIPFSGDWKDITIGRVGNVAVINSSNDIFVGGSFTGVNGKAVYDGRKISKFSSGGTVDSSFSGGVDNTVYAIVPNDDGSVYVGGDFVTVNGTNDFLTKIGQFGELENTYKPLHNLGNGSINSAVIDNNGKILVNGIIAQFDGPNGGPRYDKSSIGPLFRINQDETLDVAFTAGTGFITNSNVSLVRPHLYADGTILVGGGSFTDWNDRAFDEFSNFAGGIIKFNNDGSLDTTWTGGTKFNQMVNTFLVDDVTGKVYVGGSFTEYDNDDTLSTFRILRLNTDGSLDTTFLQTGETASSEIRVIIFANDGDLLIGARDGNSMYKRLRDGGHVKTFKFLRDGGGVATVDAIVQDSQGRIYVAGDLGQYNPNDTGMVDIPSGLVRLNPDFTIDTTFSVSGSSGFENAFGNPANVRTLALDEFNERIFCGSNQIDMYNDVDLATDNLAILSTVDGSLITDSNIVGDDLIIRVSLTQFGKNL